MNFVKEQGGTVPGDFVAISERISRTGGTPLAVADGPRLLGIVHLKDLIHVLMQRGGFTKFNLKDVMRVPIFVPETVLEDQEPP